MKILFRSISGPEITGSFTQEDTIQSACQFLGSFLNCPPQLIRIRNFEDFTFLNDNYKIADSIVTKCDATDSSFLIYFVLPLLSINDEDHSIPMNLAKEVDKTDIKECKLNHDYYSELIHSRKLIIPPQAIFSVFDFIEKEPSPRAILIYKSYARSLDIPLDFDEKVETLHQMGYEIEESKEALRASEFNVEAAVNRLINNQNNHNFEDDLREGIRITDLFHIISMIADEDGNVDHDRIGNIIRIFTNRNPNRHDDNNEQNEDNRRHRIRFFLNSHNNSNDDNTTESNSIDNDELSDAMSELNEKLDEIDLSKMFESFSRLVDESRDVIARSKDDQIIEFISFLNSYLDNNSHPPRYFQKKMEHLSEYFQDENDLDIDYLIDQLHKLIKHNYENDNSDSNSDDENDETINEEEEVGIDFSSDNENTQDVNALNH